MNAVRGFCLIAAAAVALFLGRPALADEPPPPADFSATTETGSLVGTVWEGVDCLQPVYAVYRFERDGVLVYIYKGRERRDGKWKQVGNRVYLETYMGCRHGEAVVHGDQFVGDSWSAGGAAHWPTLLRQCKSP